MARRKDNKRRSNATMAVQTDSEIENDKTKGAVAVALYDQQAVDQVFNAIANVPDLDEVLRELGVTRNRLRVLLYDDEISQATETREDAICALNLSLEPGEGDESEFIAEQIGKHLRSIVQGAFKARLFGYSVIENVYERRKDGRIGLKYSGEKPMEWFKPQQDGTLRYLDPGFANVVDSIDGVPVDQTYKFMLTRNKSTWQNPYGEPLLSRLYWPWFFRNNGWKFWGKFLERFGAPLLVGKSTDTQAMVNALTQAHAQSVMGIDQDDSVEAIGTASGNNGQAFEAFENASIRRIQKVILGQTLTSGTDGGSGNRALGEIHNNVRGDKLESDIKLVLPTIQRIVDALCLLNGYSKIEAKYSSEMGLEEVRAERDGKLHNLGVRFNEEYIVDIYGVKQDHFKMTSGAPVTDPASNNKGTPDSDNEEMSFNKKFLTFTNRNLTFTKNQQMVEEIGNAALSDAGQPLSEDLIKRAIFAATDLEDLEQRLMILFESDETSTQTQFAKTVEAAIAQAQTLGYIHADKD